MGKKRIIKSTDPKFLDKLCPICSNTGILPYKPLAYRGKGKVVKSLDGEYTIPRFEEAFYPHQFLNIVVLKCPRCK